MEGIALQTGIPNQQIALRGVRLRSSVAALAERTVVEQTFVNREPQAIEAIYTFPLPDDAAVCHFEVITGDRVLTGVVEETEQAIEKYEAAIDRGDAAYLLEQERPDVFTIRVGNIKPRQAATVRLTYVRPLKVVDRQIRLAYPTTVAPRYVSDTGSGDPLEAQIDGDAVNPPQALHVPYGMSVEIELDLGAGVTAVDSPSHAIRVQEDENHRRRVTFAGAVSEMNRDFVLDIRLAKEQRPSVVVVKGDGARGAQRDHFLAVTFMPEFEVQKLMAPEPAETVFVLDCSGSMSGDSMVQATKALELCLRSLGEGDTFNICRFGSRFELMRSEPVRYSGQTLRQALSYIRRDADLGGTELFPPLQAIFHSPPAIGGVRNIVLLTDGQVSNEPEVIALARKHRAHNRIFSFGIGAAASANLVNGLARATGGAAEFISEGERIDEKVLRAFGRMASPMVSDVEIDWGGADVQTLAEIPPIFDGDAVAIYARALGSPPKEVTLKCKLIGAGGAGGSREAKWTLPVGYAIPDDGIVATMWARRAIQSFEEVNGVRRMSARLREKNRDRERLIALSKQFNLVCSLTSFIAVEHRTLAERNEGQPAVRRVPVMLAKGWGGAAAGGAAVLACASVAPGTSAYYGSSRRRGMRGAPAGGVLRDAIGETDDRALSGLLDKTMDRTLDRSIDRLRDSIGECEADQSPDAPLLKLLAAIIGEALKAGADSVELEPASDRVTALMVTGGARREMDRIPLRMHKPLASLIKRLASLDPDQTGRPQAGAMVADVDGHRVTFPVRVKPSSEGDAIGIDLPPSQHGVMAAIKRRLRKPCVRLLDPAGESLMLLLALQSAEGSFEFLPAGVATRSNEMQRALEALPGVVFAGVTGKVFDTAMCLLSLQTTHASRRDLWRRAHAKGVRFVASALCVKPEEVTALLDRLAQARGAQQPAPAQNA